MAVRVRVLEKAEVIERWFAGEVSLDELRASAEAATALVRDHGIDKVFTDCRFLRRLPCLAEIQSAAEAVFRTGPNDPSYREALVLPLGAASSASVERLATFGRSRGYTIRSFRHWREAMDWLRE